MAWASRAFLHMMFRDGFFHCDPHPGNLIVDRAGRIAIIDFGMNERLEPGVLAAVRDHLRASVLRDRELFASSLVAAGAIDARDLPVAREIAELAFDPALYNLTPQEVAGLDFTAALLAPARADGPAAQLPAAARCGDVVARDLDPVRARRGARARDPAARAVRART